MRYVTAAAGGVLALALLAGCQKAPKEEEILPPPKIVKTIPADANPLRKVYEAEELGPEVTLGELTSDPAASNQMSLYVKSGGAKIDEFVAWGPYEEIAPGAYIARGRLKAASLPDNDDQVLWLDVAGSPKANREDFKVLTGKALRRKDFPDPDKYYTFQINFDVNEAFVFELRTKYLQKVELWLDWTSLELAQ
ncbi:MAG: hypothetical protein JSU81_04920 [Candidatus Coatesbacteria bacterium]|nr:MAG: hypothetical protein JSU81_04920 [Candidatus Coatesbacteria bacterium]